MFRRFASCWFTLGFALATSSALGQPAAPVPASAAVFQETVVPLMYEYCVVCHYPSNEETTMDVEVLLDAPTLSEHREMWEFVLHQLERGEMPPETEVPPPAEDVQKLMAWVRSELAWEERQFLLLSDTAAVLHDKQAEYLKAVQEMVGIEFQPAEVFPELPGAAAEDPAAEEGAAEEGNVEAAVEEPDEASGINPLTPEEENAFVLAAQRIAYWSVFGREETGASDGGAATEQQTEPAAAAEQDASPPAGALTESPATVFVCDHGPGEHDEACLRRAAAGWALRAYGPEAADPYVQPILDLIAAVQEEGQTVEQGVATAIFEIIVSPAFLQRVVRPEPPATAEGDAEVEAAADEASPAQPAAAGPPDDPPGR